ncbi:MAG TPA: amidohydrolase family protein [Pirellulales bacterium]|nr:amidohydrolase family protein [Pirellulales bacterium]
MNPQTLSRRDFHRHFTAAALACSPAFAGPARAEPTGKTSPGGHYFDIHTHVGQTWNTDEPLTAETLLRWMDAHGVEQAVVLPLISPEASSYPLTTDFVLAETRPHRDRLVPFCSIDPRTSFEGGHKGLVGMLARYVEAGAKGFGEHKPGVKIDSPRNLALFAACDEVKLPVLLHLDNERNLDLPGLPGLAKVLKALPGVNFIAHGPGWWASISASATQADLGGYPRGEIAPGGAVDELLAKFPNLFGDLSAPSGANAIGRDEKFAREFLIRRADQLLFGSDFLEPRMDVPQFELFDKLDLPPEVEAKIFRDNARRVLGFDTAG